MIIKSFHAALIKTYKFMQGRLFITVLFSILIFSVQAQPVEMADRMRADGKIYVVVAILSLILVGLLAYVFTTDRKITRLEKKITDKDLR